jgi:hypothetical protein
MNKAARAFAGILLLSATLSAAESPSLDWLHDLLEKSSRVQVPAEDGAQGGEISTTTDGKVNDGVLILHYVLRSYKEGTRDLASQQQILYQVRPESLSADSLDVQELPGPADAAAGWIVTVRIVDGADFIVYDNIFEAYNEDGKPELTRSHGRVRQVALGYFANRGAADELVKKFRAYLQTLHVTPDVKRPGQSAA